MANETDSRAPLVTPRPKARPDYKKPRYLDPIFTGESGDEVVVSSEYYNPVTMLGQIQGSDFRQYPNDNLSAYGAYLPPREQGGVEYLGGPAPDSRLGRFYEEATEGGKPLEVDDVIIVGEKGLDSQTVSHEFMHRGFERIRETYDKNALKERFGDSVAAIIENPNYEHYLLQEMFERQGGESSPNYLENLTEESREKVSTAVDAIYQVSEEMLGELGYQTNRDMGPRRRPVVKLNQEGEQGFFGGLMKKIGFAKGGSVSMEKQMELFEHGGLADDGMDKDPVSGNDVPSGSMAKEVRDDVDAKLSEGEYVVPADVVRFYGVSYFEKLRKKAKEGLEEMDEDGRIGGKPAEGPSIEEDLMTIDGYATGGVVQPNVDIDGIINRVKAAAEKDPGVVNMLKSKGIFLAQPEMQTPQNTQAGANQPLRMADGGDVLDSGFGPEYGTSRVTPGHSQTPTSTFNPMDYQVGYSAYGTPEPSAATGAITYVEYRGPNGEVMMVPMQNGQPMTPIPEGYVLAADYQEPRSSRDRSRRVEEPRDPRDTTPNLLALSEDELREHALKESRMPGGGLLGVAGELDEIGRIREAIRIAEYNGFDGLASELGEREAVMSEDLGFFSDMLDDNLASGERGFNRQIELYGDPERAEETRSRSPVTPVRSSGSSSGVESTEEPSDRIGLTVDSPNRFDGVVRDDLSYGLESELGPEGFGISRTNREGPDYTDRFSVPYSPSMSTPELPDSESGDRFGRVGYETPRGVNRRPLVDRGVTPFPEEAPVEPSSAGRRGDRSRSLAERRREARENRESAQETTSTELYKDRPERRGDRRNRSGRGSSRDVTTSETVSIDLRKEREDEKNARARGLGTRRGGGYTD